MIHYPFTNLSDLAFEFRTDHGTVYHAYFIAYGELFSAYPEFAENVYSFNLEVAVPEIDTQPADNKIAQTIVAIFLYFFNSRKNVAIYICDSSDEKHLARKRKFDFWFWRYNNGSILKEDGLAVIADMEIYNSIIIHKQNPKAETIINAFRTLNERADDK